MRAQSWIKAARKEFETFPQAVQEKIKSALGLAAVGILPGDAKPLKGFVDGVFEISAPFKSDTWRAVYALKLDDDIWVVHAFQKKSVQGIKTQKHEMDLIRERIRRLKEQLK